MKRAVVIAIAFASGACFACGSSSAREPSTSSGEAVDYPGILHPPSELSPDFVVEQHVELAKGDRHGGFDGVLQKRGSELVVVGLGPAGVRAFVLRQEGTEARFEQSMGPPLPFPPRNVLIDIHRAFFKRLAFAGASADGRARDGVERGSLDGEEVTEIWRAGALVERRFVRDAFRKGAVRVLYGPGCGTDRCEPQTVRIINEWFGYTIFIENRRYHSLQKS
jgi:Protein of unknown function (DUF3261)